MAEFNSRDGAGEPAGAAPFGTHHLPDGQWPAAYGVAGHPVPRGYWKQLLFPFRR